MPASAGVAGWMGGKALSRVRPFRFPVSGEELSRDFRALRAAWSRDGAQGEGSAPAVTVEGPRTREAALEDLEERFRAGAE